MNWLKIFLILSFFLVGVSASSAVIIGVSPASREVTMYPGETKNISFGLSSNSTTDVRFYCTSESPYITCPATIVLINGSMTFFNATVSVPEDVQFNSTTDIFKICMEKGNATVISCLGPKVTINIDRSERAVEPKEQELSYIEVLTYAIIAVIGMFLIWNFSQNKKLIKHKKKHK